MEKKKLLTIGNANILYFIPMALFFIIDEMSQRIKAVDMSYGSKLVAISLLEVAFVLIPVIIFAYIKKWDVKYLFRLNKLKFSNIALSVVIMLFAIPVTAFINGIVIFILLLLGKAHAQPSFPADNFLQLFLTLFAIAVVPAVVEEVLCRGAILRGYEKWGVRAALLMSSLLFALLHRDIQSLVGTFLLGLLIAYIVYRTNSIFAGMVAHFTNNGFVVVISFLSTMISKRLGNTVQQPTKMPDLSSLGAFPKEQLILAGIFLMVVAVVFAIALVGWILLLRYNTRNVEREVTETSEEKPSKLGSILLYASFALVLFRYFQELI